MKRFESIIRLLCVSLVAIGFTACTEEDDYFSTTSQNTPISISRVFLEDADSSVPDREVTFARLGQVIRVEGSGFYGVKYIYVNGYETYFNRAYVTDSNILFQLDEDTPITDAEEDERNIIRFVKDGVEGSFTFDIRAAAPSISYISNTLPQPGETVFVYGTNLHETTSITLPGDIAVSSDGIDSDDEEGTWYSFVMPSGVTEGGSITSVGVNGTAMTPAYFNENSCYILNFDGMGTQGYWSWSETSSMCDSEHDVVNDPLSSGRGLCAMLVPQRLLDAGVQSGKSRVSEWWTAGNDDSDDDWSRMYTTIPEETPVSEVALQFDIYVPEAWTGTGQIQINLINNYNLSGIGTTDDGTSSLVNFYVPWIEDGATVDFITTDGWQTVTIPFSEFNKYAYIIESGETEPTFQTVVEDRNAATYRNFGMAFVNTDFTLNSVEYISETFNSRIYVDNWRVVPCASFTVSDFPDDEEEE